MLTEARTYDELYRDFRWDVPARFNIATACCDRHADGSGRLALVYVNDDGTTTRTSFDEVADMSRRFANVLVADGLKDLSLRLGFRYVDGFAERVVYREFFPRGLTALDEIDEATLGMRPNLGHLTAREEVTSLLRQLKLPLDERGRRRAANRAEWFSQVDKPLEVHDILGA